MFSIRDAGKKLVALVLVCALLLIGGVMPKSEAWGNCGTVTGAKRLTIQVPGVGANVCFDNTGNYDYYVTINKIPYTVPAHKHIEKKIGSTDSVVIQSSTYGWFTTKYRTVSYNWHYVL